MPFRPRIVHAYLVRTARDRWMLVDGGLNTEAAWAVLDSAIRDVAGGWERLSLHFVTHMHLDHVGLAVRVRHASGAPLAMGRLDAERAAHAAAEPEEETGYRAGLLSANGAPDELVRSVQTARTEADPLGSFVPADLPLPCATVPVPECDDWIAVWTPGHTAGHTSLLRPGDGTLLAGDALLPAITPTIGVNRQRDDPVRDYLHALDRLADLGPARALAGHGDAIERPSTRIQELRRATREETERTSALLAEVPASAWEVTAARYVGRELPPSQRMLALRETLAHLQHLAALGRAVTETAAGVVRYRSA